MRIALLMASLLLMIASNASAQHRPRAREAGITFGILPTGALNAITDVAGVKVGQVTIIEGNSIRTGVTAVLPHGGNLYQDKVPAGFSVGNAYGKFMGSTQIEELGEIETPILLTNTLNVAEAASGIVGWTLEQPGNEQVRSVNAVVGETNDGSLNDIRARRVRAADAIAAIQSAKAGPVDEGAVGAGTGTIAFGWKGGIGTSSRVLRQQNESWTVGVLAQTNFGGRLTIAGVPIWRELTPAGGGGGTPADGSCMIVVATDAPLDARDLKRLAARAVFALARTGSTYSNGSGDFAIAFSTAAGNRIGATNGPQARSFLPTDAVSGLFEAVLDATEEAVYNSLLKATDTIANGRTVRAL